MGTSRPFYLSEFCNFLINNRPQTILDIGPGFGKNGFLCSSANMFLNCNIMSFPLGVFGYSPFQTPITTKNPNFLVWDFSLRYDKEL